MDLAELGLSAQYKKITEARKELDNFTDSAKKAEDAAEDFADENKKAETATGSLAAMLGRTGIGFSTVSGLILGAAAAVGTFIAGAASLNTFVDATVEMEAQQAQLAAAIKSTGGAAGQTVEELNAHAAALQRVTNYGDDTVSSAQAILLTFTKIGGDVFPRATEAITDVATRLGTDLNSAALQVGKALNDPVLGMTALSRAGIQFTEQQKALVQSFVDSGNIIAAQTIILKELEIQFGGSARAARETLGGAIVSLSNAFGDLFELGQGASEPLRQAIEGLIVAISTEEFSEFVKTIGAGLFAATSLAVEGLTMLVDILPTLYDIVMVLGPALAVMFGPAIISSVTALATTVTSAVIPAFVTLGTVIAANPIGAIATVIVALISYLYQMREELGLTEGAWARVWNIIGAAATNVVEAFVGFYDTVAPYVEAVYDLVVSLATVVNDTLVSAFVYLRETVGPIFEWMLSTLEDITGATEGAANAANKAKPANDNQKAPTASKAVEEGGKKAAKAIGDSMDKGGESAAKNIGKSMDSGAKQTAQAGQSAGKAVSQAFSDGGKAQTNINDVFVAKFEGTGRNIYDLWNNWGNSFIDSFGTTIGDLLVDYQNAMTDNLKAQAELFKAQAEQIKLQNEMAEKQKRSPNTYGGGNNSTASSSANSGSSFTETSTIGNIWGETKKPISSSSWSGPSVTTDLGTSANQNTPISPVRPVVNLKVVNQNDPLDALNALATAEGEDQIINVIANNAETFKSILGVA